MYVCECIMCVCVCASVVYMCVRSRASEREWGFDPFVASRSLNIQTLPQDVIRVWCKFFIGLSKDKRGGGGHQEIVTANSYYKQSGQC